VTRHGFQEARVAEEHRAHAVKTPRSSKEDSEQHRQDNVVLSRKRNTVQTEKVIDDVRAETLKLHGTKDWRYDAVPRVCAKLLTLSLTMTTPASFFGEDQRVPRMLTSQTIRKRPMAGNPQRNTLC